MVWNSTSQLTIVTLNVQGSLINHINKIKECIKKNNLDFVCIQEIGINSEKVKK